MTYFESQLSKALGTITPAWHTEVKNLIAKAVDWKTEIELPTLYTQLKIKFPTLTPEEFRNGMRQMYENDELLLMDYTRAPAEIADNPATILIPARSKKGGIYDDYKYSVRVYPRR